VRARLLDASGEAEQAMTALQRAVEKDASPDLCIQALSFLVSKDRRAEALRLTETAAARMPESREILLMRATTLEWAERTPEAFALLQQMQTRWPEWSAVWAARGILQAAHGRSSEAVPALEAATALGAQNPEVYFFLAKVYDASGRKHEAQAAREHIPAAERNTSEPAYLKRVFGGSLLQVEANRAWQ